MRKNYSLLLVSVIFLCVGIACIVFGSNVKSSLASHDFVPLDRILYMVGGLFILIAIASCVIVLVTVSRRAAKIKYLKEQGIPGKASVISWRYTGVRANGIMQVKLNLDVTSNLGEKFEVTYRCYLNPMHHHIIQSNEKIPVLIDPKNPKNFILELDSL